MYRLPLLLCALSVFSGCASRAYRLYPIPSKSSGIDYLLERECLFSNKKASTVVVCDVRHNERNEFLIYLAVKNESNRDIVFKPSVQVLVDYREDSGEYDDVGKPIHYEDVELYTYRPEEYLDLMGKRAQSQVTTNAILGAIAASNAGTETSSTYTTASASAYGSDGSSAYATGSASSSTTSTNAVAQQMAMNRAERNTKELRTALKAEISKMSQAVFPRNKVKPGTTTDGIILVDDGRVSFSSSQDTYLVVYVDIEGERHKMYFSKVPAG